MNAYGEAKRSPFLKKAMEFIYIEAVAGCQNNPKRKEIRKEE
jgi:hypothetical protein